MPFFGLCWLIRIAKKPVTQRVRPIPLVRHLTPALRRSLAFLGVFGRFAVGLIIGRGNSPVFLKRLAHKPYHDNVRFNANALYW